MTAGVHLPPKGAKAHPLYNAMLERAGTFQFHCSTTFVAEMGLM
jgi:hypothetical protein